jgi:IBR domain, a half RING-finger domain
MVRTRLPLRVNLWFRNLPLSHLQTHRVQDDWTAPTLIHRAPAVWPVHDGDDTSEALAASSSSHKKTCSVCLTEAETPSAPFPTVVCPSGCSDVCKPCLTGYLTSCARSRRWPVPCISCKIPLEGSECVRLVDGPDCDALQLLVLERVHTRVLKYCSNVRCSTPFDFEGPGNATDAWANMVRCPLCSQRTCVACCQPWHDGPCDLAPREDGEELLARVADSRGWRKCPGCATFAEKEVGCNFCVCLCGAKFCWKCLTPYRTTNPYRFSLRGNVHGVPNCRCDLYDTAFDSD